MGAGIAESATGGTKTRARPGTEQEVRAKGTAAAAQVAWLALAVLFVACATKLVGGCVANSSTHRIQQAQRKVSRTAGEGVQEVQL